VLDGRHALVTGAGSGIGAAIASALAAAGASVAINDVSNSFETEHLVASIARAGGRVIRVRGDVSDEAAVKAMFREVVDAFGTLDILVNNVGIRSHAPVYETTLANWNRVLGVNLTGHFLCAREAIGEFLHRKVPRSRARAAGNIICISSVHEHIPWAGHASYAASKGGVMMLMKTLAQELAAHKIRVNSIAPGVIKTPGHGVNTDTPEKAAALLELIPYGRTGLVDDIANAAVWLASDLSDYVTGTTLYVDGGMTLCPGFREEG
jgi:glucose 1-dehydrogenase